MSKHHIGVTTKLKKDVVARLETIAIEKGIKRSALIRQCLLDFLAAQSTGKLPSFTPKKQNSSAA